MFTSRLAVCRSLFAILIGVVNCTLIEAQDSKTKQKATQIVKDPEMKKWQQTFQALREFARKGFPGAIDIVNSDKRDSSKPGPSIDYILSKYGKPDKTEEKKSIISGIERIYYWYGPLGIIVSKQDKLIWGFAGEPPQSK